MRIWAGKSVPKRAFGPMDTVDGYDGAVPETAAQASRAYNDNVATPQTRRSRGEVARFFDGLELVEPGLVQLADWRPGPDHAPAPTSGYGAVARKR